MKRYKASEIFNHLKAILSDTWSHTRESHLLLVASSLAYTSILSLIPLLAVSFAVFHTFGGLDKLYGVIEPFILSYLTKGAGEQALNSIRGFIDNIQIKKVGVGGLLGLLVTCMSLFSSVEKSINRVWKTQSQRSFFQKIAMYWFILTLGPIGFAVSMAAITSQKIKYSTLFPGGTAEFLVLGLTFSLIYKWTPHRTVHWFSAIFPGILTSAILTLAKNLYTIYTHHFVNYNKIYGSLAAIPILLVWIYIIWVVVLSGAALGAALQKRLELK